MIIRMTGERGKRRRKGRGRERGPGQIEEVREKCEDSVSWEGDFGRKDG